MASAADYVDEASAVLGGEDADFLVKGIPGSREHPYAVGLFCQVCGPMVGVYSITEVELWELIADARAHYEDKHRAA